MLTIRRAVLAAAAGLSAYGVTRGVIAWRDRLDSKGSLKRVNHAGHTVSLIEGPAVMAGLAVSGLFLEPPRLAVATTGVTLGSGLLGLLDDMSTDTANKGFGGHIRALRQGRVTTGALKALGIPLLSVTGAYVLGKRGIWAVCAGGVTAGTANVLNLCDLRPGRALKAGLVLLTLDPRITANAHSAGLGALGVIAAALPHDLQGRTMLGDTGANALGAALAQTWVYASGNSRILMRLAILTGLTVLSERVSFSRIIATTPGLREFDAWGREITQAHHLQQSTDRAV